MLCGKYNLQSERTFETPCRFKDEDDYERLRGCLHDTGATFAPERVHSGSLSWPYICLHDTTTNFMLAGRSLVNLPKEESTRCKILFKYAINMKQFSHRNDDNSLDEFTLKGFQCGHKRRDCNCGLRTADCLKHGLGIKWGLRTMF